MGRPVFLLGAGASIDSGLCDTNALTEMIYNKLTSKVPKQIFGYAISKVLSRKTRQGYSPFDKINVEEAYDAVEKLVFRNDDIVSEFVASWDPFLEALNPNFNVDRFAKNFEGIFRTRSRSLSGGGFAVTVDRSKIHDIGKQVSEATSRSNSSKQKETLLYLLGALITCLDHDRSKISHVEQLVRFSADNGGVIGSLNYDLVIENSAENLGVTLDYGISHWNQKKIVNFSGSKAGIKLHKLHGSMNWSGNDDDIVIKNENNIHPLLIFGGSNGKLRPDGPFLQMRHEFERSLLSTNALVIVGYSFSDGHLNALIRRWSSTRRKAKLIIVDPGNISYKNEHIGTTYRMENNKISSLTVEIIHIKKRFSQSVDDIINLCNGTIDLSIDRSKSGAIPQIYSKVIS